jgi:hypothetical protein
MREHKRKGTRLVTLFATGLLTASVGLAANTGYAAASSLSDIPTIVTSTKVSYTVYFIDSFGFPVQVQGFTDATTGDEYTAESLTFTDQDRTAGANLIELPTGTTPLYVYGGSLYSTIVNGNIRINPGLVVSNTNVYVVVGGNYSRVQGSAALVSGLTGGSVDPTTIVQSNADDSQSSAADNVALSSAAESSVAQSSTASLPSSSAQQADAVTSSVDVVAQVGNMQSATPASSSAVATVANFAAAEVISSAATQATQASSAANDAVAAMPEEAVGKGLFNLDGGAGFDPETPYHPWAINSIATAGGFIVAATMGLVAYLKASGKMFK